MLEAADEFDPVHYRHIDIAEDQIQWILGRDVERICAVIGFFYFGEFNARLTQAALDNFPHHGRVVNNERPYTLHGG